MYRIIEHFALGRRRLELFGEDHNIRAGWLAVGNGISSSNFNREVCCNLNTRFVKVVGIHLCTFLELRDYLGIFCKTLNRVTEKPLPPTGAGENLVSKEREEGGV